MSKVVIAVGYLVLILGRQTMDNDSVVRLMKAGFSEDVIISAINRSLGGFDASVDGLIALKKAGVTNKEILAIVAKAYPAQSTHKPRLFLRGGGNEPRDQAMEMRQDFQEVCPEVQISRDQHLVDYTVELNHTVREDQMKVANKDGDLVSNTREGGSIKGDVKQACEVILEDWARK